MYDKLVLGLALVLMSGNAMAKSDCAEGEINCWSCSTNKYVLCTARLSADGAMSITGNGNMDTAPWGDKMTDIKSVTIGEGIKNVGSSAFSGASSLTNVSFSSSVTSIGSDAFSGSGLTQLNIPSSVTDIGYRAFENTTDLTNVHIAEDSQLKEIRQHMFRGSGLTSINIPTSVTTIGRQAFQNSGLTSVDIPASVTSIDGGAFAGTINLTNAHIAEDSQIETLSNLLFYHSGIQKLNLPDSVVTIGDQAFEGATNLEEIYISPNSQLKDINSRAFFRASLENIDLPNGLVSIGSGAFYSSKIISLRIPDSVLSIGGSAFTSTDNLIEILFSENSKLESLSEVAFYNSVALKALVLPPNLQFEPDTILSLYRTNSLKNLYITAEQAANLGFKDRTNFTPTIYQMNPDGTVSIMANVSEFLGIESQSLPKVAYASFADLVTGTISEQYTYEGNKKRVWDANGNYKYYCRYQTDFSSACFTKKGKFLGRYDSKGNRIYKKIYTVEEAMEATKDGDRFHVYLTYK